MTDLTTSLDDEQLVYDLADKIYWQVLQMLDIESKCVEVTETGTQNTELGTMLYYTIESTIEDYLEELNHDNILHKSAT